MAISQYCGGLGESVDESAETSAASAEKGLKKLLSNCERCWMQVEELYCSAVRR